jgi:hypothetical protein
MHNKPLVTVLLPLFFFDEEAAGVAGFVVFTSLVLVSMLF